MWLCFVAHLNKLPETSHNLAPVPYPRPSGSTFQSWSPWIQNFFKVPLHYIQRFWCTKCWNFPVKIWSFSVSGCLRDLFCGQYFFSNGNMIFVLFGCPIIKCLKLEWCCNRCPVFHTQDFALSADSRNSHDMKTGRVVLFHLQVPLFWKYTLFETWNFQGLHHEKEEWIICQREETYKYK